MSLYKYLKAVVQIAESSSDIILVKRKVRQGGVFSTFLYLVYVNDLLNVLEISGCVSKVISVQGGNPTFADDISLLALTPLHLQRMIDSMFKFCHQWDVSINVDKSTITLLTKSCSKPVVNTPFSDHPIKQTKSFVHLGFFFHFI